MASSIFALNKENFKENIKVMNKLFSDITNPDSDTNNFKPIPIFITQTQANNYKSYPPYIVNSYPNQYGFYKDLNKDKSVRKNITKYYYYKILDKWIYGKLMPLLAFIDISHDKPQLIKSLSQFDAKKVLSDTPEQIEKKIDYFEKNIITKDIVKHVLKKILMNNTNINWYDLHKYEEKIKTVFYNYFLDKLKHSIEKYGEKE